MSILKELLWSILCPVIVMLFVAFMVFIFGLILKLLEKINGE